MQKLGIPQTGLRFLIIILLVLGTFFRFVNLEQKVYWHDEVFTSMRISAHSRAELVERAFTGREISPKDLQEYQQLDPKRGLFLAVKLLGIEDAQHPPLYYVMLRLWVQWLGNSITVIRSWSALISLLVLPCLYWLCQELFASSLTGWIAIALTCISPLHVLFAQEAREYSLWTVSILLSSAALLRAMRLRTKLSWGIYAIAVAVGLYTFLFSGLVMLGHGIYVLLRENLRLSKTGFAYLTASFWGILTFTPWLWFVITYFFIIRSSTAWIDNSLPQLSLIQTWAFNYSRLFIDFDISFDNFWAYCLIAPILCLEVYSIYWLCRQTPKQVYWFVITLIGGTVLTLALPDLILGGQRSSIGRYLFPCFLGVQLSVAHLLANEINSIRPLRQKIWQIVTVVVISVGILSCAASARADTWWNKVNSYYNPAIARMLNQMPQPLLISDAYAINPANIVSLSYLLNQKVQLLLLPEVGVNPQIPEISASFRNIYLLNLPEVFRDRFEKKYRGKLINIIGDLWKLEQ